MRVIDIDGYGGILGVRAMGLAGARKHGGLGKNSCPTPLERKILPLRVEPGLLDDYIQRTSTGPKVRGENTEVEIVVEVTAFESDKDVFTDVR